MENAKYLGRVAHTPYLEDKTVSIGAGGGSDTVENVPKVPTAAYEFEIDGKRIVFLGYEHKD